MKKIYYCILVLIVSFNIFSDQVSLNYAQTVAQNWYSMIYETENTAIADYSIETSQGIQTAFIFNFCEGGFVITSASNDAEPILAYNDVGEINSDRSPGLTWLINCYNEQVFEIITEDLICQSHRDTWSDLYESIYVENRTEVILQMDPTWNQSSPYNNFAPLIDGDRCVAGCGPIAMAQIINYHKYMSDYTFSNGLVEPNYGVGIGDPLEPDYIYFEIDEDASDYGFPTFAELDNSLLNVRSFFDSGNSLWPDGEDYDYAALSFGCGIACKAMYDTGGTGVYGCSNYERYYALNFGYNSVHYYRNSYQYDWEILLRNEIDQNRLIQYGGRDVITGPPYESHAFILQGYSIDVAAEPCLYYVNWGWGHDPIHCCDGWFLLDDLTPNTSHSFIDNQRAIVEIKPASFTIIGQLSAYFPECSWGTFTGPLSANIVAYYNNGSGIIETDGVYCDMITGQYYIQLDEQLPIGTEFWITIESNYYEDVIIYDEITSNSNVHYVETTELFWDTKPLFNNWNWESFPNLERTGNGTVEAISVFDDIPGFPQEITQIDIQNLGPIGLSPAYGILHWDEINQWSNQGYELQSTRCFKIQVLPELEYDFMFRELDVPGTLLSETESIDLLAGQDNWIGYWIQETQDIDDAFGDDWENIESIKAEDWEWKDMSNNRGLEPAYYPIRPLNYGKGYVVRVKEDILGFQWHVSGGLGTPYTRQSPQDFIYEEKPDYESVIIDTIDGGSNIVEVGVFENEVCVGAAVINEFPLQILAYTDAVNLGGELTFQFSYGGGRGYQAAEGYSVLNPDTGFFENRSVILGELEHNIFRLYADEEQEIVPEIGRTVLHSNYPNPFNPTTQISLFIPQEGKVNLAVYNIKGQLVKTLINRRIIPGSHIVNWNGQDNAGKRVSSGVYFYKLKTADKEISKKMLLLK